MIDTNLKKVIRQTQTPISSIKYYDSNSNSRRVIINQFHVDNFKNTNSLVGQNGSNLILQMNVNIESRYGLARATSFIVFDMNTFLFSDLILEEAGILLPDKDFESYFIGIFTKEQLLKNEIIRNNQADMIENEDDSFVNKEGLFKFQLKKKQLKFGPTYGKAQTASKLFALYKKTMDRRTYIYGHFLILSNIESVLHSIEDFPIKQKKWRVRDEFKLVINQFYWTSESMFSSYGNTHNLWSFVGVHHFQAQYYQRMNKQTLITKYPRGSHTMEHTLVSLNQAEFKFHFLKAQYKIGWEINIISQYKVKNEFLGGYDYFTLHQDRCSHIFAFTVVNSKTGLKDIFRIKESDLTNNAESRNCCCITTVSDDRKTVTIPLAKQEKNVLSIELLQFSRAQDSIKIDIDTNVYRQSSDYLEKPLKFTKKLKPITVSTIKSQNVKGENLVINDVVFRIQLTEESNILQAWLSYSSAEKKRKRSRCFHVERFKINVQSGLSEELFKVKIPFFELSRNTKTCVTTENSKSINHRSELDTFMRNKMSSYQTNAEEETYQWRTYKFSREIILSQLKDADSLKAGKDLLLIDYAYKNKTFLLHLPTMSEMPQVLHPPEPNIHYEPNMQKEKCEISSALLGTPLDVKPLSNSTQIILLFYNCFSSTMNIAICEPINPKNKIELLDDNSNIPQYRVIQIQAKFQPTLFYSPNIELFISSCNSNEYVTSKNGVSLPKYVVTGLHQSTEYLVNYTENTCERAYFGIPPINTMIQKLSEIELDSYSQMDLDHSTRLNTLKMKTLAILEQLSQYNDTYFGIVVLLLKVIEHKERLKQFLSHMEAIARNGTNNKSNLNGGVDWKLLGTVQSIQSKVEYWISLEMETFGDAFSTLYFGDKKQ